MHLEQAKLMSQQVEQENTNQHGHEVCVCLDVVSVFFLYFGKIPQRRSAKPAHCLHRGSHPVHTPLDGFF